MKNLFIALFIIPFCFVSGQEDIVVSLKDKLFTQGEVPAFVVFIPQADFNELNKDWEKYLKQDTKEKTILENGEIVILNKMNEKISSKPLNIYSYVKEYDGEIMLVVAIQLDGQFISRDMQEIYERQVEGKLDNNSK